MQTRYVRSMGDSPSPRGSRLQLSASPVETTSWLFEPRNMHLFLRAQIASTILGPATKFALILTIKKSLDVLCGRSIPGLHSTQPRRQRFRSAVLAQIPPDGHLLWFTELLGVHYELVSKTFRALGAKVGKRVYWPALGPFMSDFDLVEIGDDVLWGAQSHLLTSDNDGKGRIKIEDKAMVADRAIISPGVTVGKRVQVGSGAVLNRDKSYAEDSVLIGNRNGQAVRFPSPVNGKGKEQDLPSTPFGRAFYMGLANYRVWTEGEIVCYNLCIMAFVAAYWAAGPLVSMAIVLRAVPFMSTPFGDVIPRTVLIYVALTLSTSLVDSIQSLIALCIVITSKWLLPGQRRPGPHPWDKSLFFQRQQLQLAVEKIMTKAHGGYGVPTFFTGMEYLNIFFRLLGAYIGTNSALFTNGRPTIMLTEPDLVSMGDRVAVDDASVVVHINTRGAFELRELKIGKGCVLRTGSRLMSGAEMGDRAVLLEQTCILPGDRVEASAVYQGWPAGPFEGVPP